MLTLARTALVWPLLFALVSGLRTPQHYEAFIWLSLLAALATLAGLLTYQRR